MRRYSNSVMVLHYLLKSFSVKHTLPFLRDKIEKHPHNPSIMALSDCLNDYWIANESLSIHIDDIQELECPFIACLTDGSYIVVERVNHDLIKFQSDANKLISISKDEFQKKWVGTILIAEPNEDSKEPDYTKNRWKAFFNSIKYPVLIAILSIGFFLALYYNHPILHISYYLLLIMNLLGLCITFILLQNLFQGDNTIAASFCRLMGENGCDGILKSDASKIFGWISWAEIGFLYYTGSLLSMLLFHSTIYLLSWISLTTFTFSIYSILYQYRKRSWCLLCCSVQLLLVSAIFITIYFKLFLFRQENSPLILSVIAVTFSFLMPTMVWFIIKPFIFQSKDMNRIQTQLNRFKYNTDLFYQILTSQQHYKVDNNVTVISIGDPKASTTITIVSNPFCEPCARAHRTIDEWLKYNEDLRLQIIFIVPAADKKNVLEHFIALALTKDEQLLERALNDWYGQDFQHYETWAKKYPVYFSEDLIEIANRQLYWCEKVNITFTPTILVNGFKLPEPYLLEDIKYLVA